MKILLLFYGITDTFTALGGKWEKVKYNWSQSHDAFCSEELSPDQEQTPFSFAASEASLSNGAVMFSFNHTLEHVVRLYLFKAPVKLNV